ncbi:MAG: hypothetical protein JNL83_31500 [Myxococcales bacterium]|nr:hypothetical protein [Myxococcales bacterium]
MQPWVVEVVARIGASIVHAAHVPADGCFRIGTHAGVDLPIADGALGAFPLVDRGLVIRVPAGVAAIATPDGATRLALGLLAIELRTVPAPREVVPRRPLELRPLPYVAAVLALHLAVWLVAMIRHPIERLSLAVAPLDAVHVRVPPVLPPPPPKQTTQKTQRQAKTSAGGAAAAQSGAPRATDAPSKPGFLGAKGLSDLSMLVPSIDVVKAVNESTFYDEDAANEKLFGGGPRFAPGKKPGWGTVKSGRYATVSKGRGAGDDYDLPGAARHPQPDIVMRVLRVAGETPREVIHHAVDLRLGAIGYCYQRMARKQLKGSLRIDWTIGIDGAVRGQRTSGMPEFAKCAADVIGVIPFDPAPTPTAVSYAFVFTPSA